jgi:hypothetical protein
MTKTWTKQEVLNTPQKEIEALAEAIARELEPHLRGKNPQAVGLALSNMVAKWIAGHHQGTEAQLLRFFDALVLQSVPAIRLLIWDAYAREHETASTPQ